MVISRFASCHGLKDLKNYFFYFIAQIWGPTQCQKSIALKLCVINFDSWTFWQLPYTGLINHFFLGSGRITDTVICLLQKCHCWFCRFNLFGLWEYMHPRQFGSEGSGGPPTGTAFPLLLKFRVSCLSWLHSSLPVISGLTLCSKSYYSLKIEYV